MLMAIMLIANDIANGMTKGYIALEFRSEVELDVLEILLSHAEHITRVSEEYIATLDIFCHVLIFTLLELIKLLGIVALYPASLVEVNRFPTTLGIIFVFKTILDNLKLKLTNSTYYTATIELVDKQLGNTLVHKLLQSLLELLALHRVVVLNIFKHLWRE